MRTYTPEVDVSFVEANGLRFGYLEEGEGPLVLLMHGFPDTAHTWDDVRPALAKAGFRAVSPFMRGYAPTEIPAGEAFTSRDLGEDVLALIGALGHDDAIIVGHDWGASAVYAAAHLGPERVKKLITVAIPHPRTLEVSLANLWKARHFFGFKMPWATASLCRHDFRVVEKLYRRWSPTWAAPAEEFEAVKNAFSAAGSAHAALGYYRCLQPKPEAMMRAKIEVPTVSFAGLDDILDPSVFDKAAWNFNGSYEVERIPGGHFMHRESPQFFVERLLAHLGS